MRTADVENFLALGLRRMGLALESQPEILARLSVYFQELTKWNTKVNLVARSLDEKQILESHFLDSLSLLLLLLPELPERKTLLDIGTGAGFPGLVVKTACPSLQVTLIEPRQKRYYFLKHMIRTLDLTEVKALNIFLEESPPAGQLTGQYFSFITSRAFTDITSFLRLASSYLESDGRIVMMKGPGAANELEHLYQDGIMPERFPEAEKTSYNLPYSQKERWLISFRRSGKKLHQAKDPLRKEGN